MTLGKTPTSIVGYLGKATEFGREIHGRLGAQLQDIEHFIGVGANDAQGGGRDVTCVEILCRAHPDNVDTIWVRTGKTATVNNAWPLAAGEIFSFNVTNLSDLQMLIVISGEKLIVAYA